MKKATVIIPNYNGKHFLNECLSSLYEDISLSAHKDDIEVLVIDNGSSDGSVEYIRSAFPSVRLIINSENKGFAPAVNQGLTQCLGGSEYAILLNNDTRVNRGFTDGLINAVDEAPDVFSAQALMLKYDNVELVDDAGDLYTILGLAFQRGHNKPASRFQKKADITSACGGACIYRCSALSDTGLLDEAFFAYREDLDLGIRARLLGYRNVFCPEASVVHYGSGTAGTGGKSYNEFKTKLGTRNLEWLHYKNFPILMRILNLPFTLIGVIIKALFYMKHGLTGCYLKSLLGAFNTNGVKRIACRPSLLWNYIRFEFEAIKNTFRIF